MGFDQILLLTLLIMCAGVQLSAVISGLVLVRKHEKALQDICLKRMFNWNDFDAHKLWYLPLSICVSFGYLMFISELFVGILNATLGFNVLKYILMNLAVGVMINQYNLYLIKDRRKNRGY